MDFKRIVTKITQRDLYPFRFTIHQYPNAIGLWKNEQESLAYFALQADPTYNWMEIGSFCGGSATILCLTKKRINAANKNIISVDRNFVYRTDETAYASFIANTAQFPDMSQMIACDSIKLSELYSGEPLSLVFIDGWHSFKGAFHDFKTVLPWLTTNAIVLFHDVAQQPWSEQFVEYYYQKALDNYDEWMSEPLPNPDPQGQTYHLDELVSYIIKEYNFELINNKVLDGTKNCMVGIRKKD